MQTAVLRSESAEIIVKTEHQFEILLSKSIIEKGIKKSIKNGIE